MKTLKIIQIFNSISGEVCSFGQGRRCTFIRLAGCNLSCKNPPCDTPFSQDINNGLISPECLRVNICVDQHMPHSHNSVSIGLP